MSSQIRVNLLGGLRVWANGTLLLNNPGRVEDAWRLFSYLVLHKKPQTKQALWAALWPALEEEEDAAQALQSAVTTLNAAFEDAGLGGGTVAYTEDGTALRLNQKAGTDVSQLESRATSLPRGKAGEEDVDTLQEVVDIYEGDLLPRLSGEGWVAPLAQHYRAIFLQAANTLCDYLYSRGRYNEVLQQAAEVSALAPLEEAFHLYTLRALNDLGRQRDIVPTYRKIERVFWEELNTPPGPELVAIFEQAAGGMDPIDQDMALIRQDLTQVEGSTEPNAPLFCSYDVLRYLYQMVARSSERVGRRAAVVLVTLRAKTPGSVPSPLAVSQGMSAVKNQILSGLMRKSDTVARYSPSQLILMFSVDKLENAQQVTQRIGENCQPLLDALELEIVFTNTEMEPVG